MYIHIPQKMKCSKCGAVDHYKEVTEHKSQYVTETYTECTKCGHKSLASTLTTSEPRDAEPAVYTAKPFDDVIDF